MKRFLVVDTNPNEAAGGGGCACSVRENADTKPPFIVFPLTDMEDPMSPHNVVCMHCVEEALREAGSEALAGGEADPVDTAETVGGTSTEDEEVLEGEVVDDPPRAYTAPPPTIGAPGPQWPLKGAGSEDIPDV